MQAGQCSLSCSAALNNHSNTNHLCLQMYCSTRVSLCLCRAGFGSRALRYLSVFFFSSLQTVSSVSTNHRETFHLERTGEFLYCCAGTGRLIFDCNRERAVLFHPCSPSRSECLKRTAYSTSPDVTPCMAFAPRQ